MEKIMEMLVIAKFTSSYDEWKAIYDGDLELRKTFMKDDLVGKVDNNTAMIKAVIRLFYLNFLDHKFQQFFL